MDQNLNYKIHTFGCKVNTYDSGLLQKNFNEEAFSVESKIHVLNTCAVTKEATKEAVRLARRLKSKDPFCTVVVTGCAAQVDTDSFENLSGVDLVVANSHKMQLPSLLRQFYAGTLKEKVFKSNIFKKEDLEMGGGVEENHTRAFLKIQDGCNSFCTYCIIPFARGKSRSIPIRDLVQRVQDLYSKGVREVVLTGVHIGDYEDENKNLHLEDLVQDLLLKTKMPRFRLSSLEPVEVSERLLEIYSDQRMCPHFHMSIQSATTGVLDQMKRKYDQGAISKSLMSIAEKIPGSFVGMDVITGFPTETDADFRETVNVLKNLPWNKIHVFPYSERPGTRAATIPDGVPWEERLKRASELRQLSFERYAKMAALQVGQTKKVLVLKKPARGTQGLSRDYWPVELLEAQNFIDHWLGQEVEVKITSYKPAANKNTDGHLQGVIGE